MPCSGAWSAGCHLSFMRIVVTANNLTGEYFSVPSINAPASAQAKRVDSFSLDLRQHRVTSSLVSASASVHGTRQRMENRS